MKTDNLLCNQYLWTGACDCDRNAATYVRKHEIGHIIALRMKMLRGVTKNEKIIKWIFENLPTIKQQTNNYEINQL
jgi:hypothetical protein